MDDNGMRTVNRFTEAMLERENYRKKNLEKKKLDQEFNCAEHEQIDYFRHEFDLKQTEIADALKYTDKVTPNEMGNHFDNITKQINLLQKFVSASTLFIKEYDVRRSQEALHNLTSQARDLENIYIPKKKFGFKTKKSAKASTPLKPVDTNNIDTVDSSSNKKSNLIESKNICGFTSRQKEKLVLTNDIVDKIDVTLHDLNECIIIIYGTPSTLHLNNLKNCTLLCGPVRTSIFAYNCHNCKMALACQQLRFHTSTQNQIYLHVTSRAIVEDCSQIQVAPYNFSYDSIHNDFQQANLDETVNNWTLINDFNWLAVDKPSPNWSVLEENERISDWTHFCNIDIFNEN